MGDSDVSREVLDDFPAALILDLDGTLYTDTGPIPGAVETVTQLRRRGVPLRFATNTTRFSRRALLEKMRGYGFVVDKDDVFTAMVAGVSLLRKMGVSVLAPFVTPEALEDLDGFELSGGTSGENSGARPEAVLMGDLGERWSPELLNEAFRYVVDGARLVALHKNRYWLGPGGLQLDAGAYVAALEYATGTTAELCGKPNAAFFHGALRTLGYESPPDASDPGRPAMVGDDIWGDVDGAKRAGLRGWLVRTGKFREDVLQGSRVRPDRVLKSVAELV